MKLSNRDLGYGIHRLNFLLERLLERGLVDAPISFSAFKILMSLHRQPEFSARQIADFLGQTEAGVSRQIEHLVAAGYLEATTNASNRRQRILTVTASGKAVGEQARIGLEATLAPVFAELDDTERSQLFELIQKVTDSAHDECRQSK